jgi:hypothetical protein
MKMVSIWEILSAISPVVAPIVSLVLLFIGKVIINHERRIRDLENRTTRMRRAVYGDKDNVQQPGLARDVEDLQDRISNLEDNE